MFVYNVKCLFNKVNDQIGFSLLDSAAKKKTESNYSQYSIIVKFTERCRYLFLFNNYFLKNKYFLLTELNSITLINKHSSDHSPKRKKEPAMEYSAVCLFDLKNRTSIPYFEI
jgi:hypothetical protein